ncbi:HNH endonuclease [Flavobacterium sp. I-STPA6A]|uniref:HNH endonuclease n=1 Tax=Flavobacterium sp. I-STPA6A TaxID=2590450 RepID=UPI00131C2DDA|nr:HNH endonuclease [Flavobacterium sp. I-STPA6A]
MRNLNSTKRNGFDFHKDIVNSKKITKNNPGYKPRLVSIENEIKGLYDIYEKNFNGNVLENSTPKGYVDTNKTDLLSLYSYKSKQIQALKTEITTTETNRIINTCQNCTLSEINSFDHVLPKDEYSEFVVNPLNLFPSCTICNSFKGKFWHENGKRKYLNLYLDKLPDKQYLFVDIDYDKETFGLKFYLENRYGIDANLFILIESHYNKLHLLQRFSDNADRVITPLQNKIKPHLKLLSIDQIKDLTIESSNLNRSVFGFNYWESILELSLIDNNDFINTLYL